MCEKSDLYPKQAIRILQVWILVYGLVGTQMAWSLRPFIGSPGQPFEVLRMDQGSNFYQAVGHAFGAFSSRRAMRARFPIRICSILPRLFLRGLQRSPLPTSPRHEDYC